jgi:hypothetical protein
MHRSFLLVIAIALTAPLVAQRYTPGRTPWGDPDLQGDYTNSNEYATPLERPERFAGKRLQDFTPDELEIIRAGAEQEAIAGLAPGPRGPDGWWLENLDLKKRRQPWLVVDPPDGRVPPLSANGRRRAQAAGRVKSSFLGGPFDGPQDFGLLERCISRGVPGSMIPVMYGNNYQIFQTPGYVVITYEIIHEARVIPLAPSTRSGSPRAESRGDGRPNLGAAIRAYMGYARGRFEGNTLVVETTNFNAATAYRGADPRTLRIVERFTKVSPNAIDWTATIEDPETWERPWTIAMPLTHDPQPVMAFECHEHNYGLVNILKAARAADARQP